MKPRNIPDGELAALAHLLPGPEPELRDATLPDGRIGVIPVSAPDLRELELEYVTSTVRSNWISSAGEMVRRFENAFAERMGCRFGVACSSGTTALHLALAALGVGPGDEVIIPAFTMIATANAVAYTGAAPVLVDCEPATGNMDVAQLESLITPATRAVIPVHIYGHPVDMAPLVAIARRHGLYVIEDAAEAHGARCPDGRVGSLGDVAAFSLYANKIITTGEGGIVTTSNRELANRMALLRDQAFSPERHFWHFYRGFNYRMSSLQAAVGLGQTERLHDLVRRRREIAGCYTASLSGIPGLRLPRECPGAYCVYWMYGIQVEDDFGMSRDQLRSWLARHGVETRSFFIPMHLQPVYFEQFRGQRFPVSEMLCRRGLYLPTFPALSEAEIEWVTGTIRSAQGSCIAGG